jgi:hypothetical protein
MKPLLFVKAVMEFQGAWTGSHLRVIFSCTLNSAAASTNNTEILGFEDHLG